MPLTAAGIGAGLGLLKSELDSVKERKDRALAAQTQRFSPWTGLQAQGVKSADPFGSALQFGTTGAMLGQGMQNSKAYQNALDSSAANNNVDGMMDKMNRYELADPSQQQKRNPWSLGFGN